MANIYAGTIMNLIVVYGMKIIIGLLILYIGFKITNKVTEQLIKNLKKKKFDETLSNFLEPLIRISLKGLIVISVVAYMGVETTSFVAVVGAATFAIGLAFQGALSNFAGGVLLIVLRPFVVGDFIDVAGNKGTVENISIFYTSLRTPDNKFVVVPNSSVTSNSLTNFSKKETRRVDLVVGVDYDSDIQEVKSTILEMVSKNEKVLNLPEPFVGLGEYGDSSINFYVRLWVNSPDYWSVYFDFQENLKVKFDEKGIEFPYPHMDLNIYKDIKAKQ